MLRSRTSSEELPGSSNSQQMHRSSNEELHRTSSSLEMSRDSTNRQEINKSREGRDRDNEEWNVEPDLCRAALQYRRELLAMAESLPDLNAGMNLCGSPQEREREMLTFYKSQPGNWARPFSVILRGDAAIGDGVKWYFLSQVISRVQFGFALDFVK
ncbi:hypothetical protein IRJ41_020763 [Triplophysa rosa]|uniref:Uncharacterized protein n=1 Tax=Triplophysa rosa TaxID=992332 RepID=A0A9W8C7Z0_TRIRA|nr:hypothetical protein IRJ41_020763 [Triplophysa rosa]